MYLRLCLNPDYHACLMSNNETISTVRGNNPMSDRSTMPPSGEHVTESWTSLSTSTEMPGTSVSSSTLLVGIASTAGAFLLILLIVFLIYQWMRRRQKPLGKFVGK